MTQVSKGRGQDFADLNYYHAGSGLTKRHFTCLRGNGLRERDRVRERRGVKEEGRVTGRMLHLLQPLCSCQVYLPAELELHTPGGIHELLGRAFIVEVR